MAGQFSWNGWWRYGSTRVATAIYLRLVAVLTVVVVSRHVLMATAAFDGPVLLRAAAVCFKGVRV